MLREAVENIYLDAMACSQIRSPEREPLYFVHIYLALAVARRCGKESLFGIGVAVAQAHECPNRRCREAILVEVQWQRCPP